MANNSKRDTLRRRRMHYLAVCFLVNGSFNGGRTAAFQPLPSQWVQRFRNRDFLSLVAQCTSATAHTRLASTRPDEIPSRKTSRNTTDRAESPKSKKRGRQSLNSEIFGLRKKKNGSVLAEKRLQAAVVDMQASAEQVQEWLATKRKKKLEQYPDEVTFNAVLTSFAKNTRRDPMAASQAERLLLQMEELSNQEFPHLSPTVFSYNAVMEAFAKLCNVHNPKRRQQNQLAVLRWFRKMRRDPNVEPNTFSNNLVLTSNAQSSVEWQLLEKWAIDYLDGKLVEILPDRNTYNQLLQIYATSGVADKAETLLQKIISSDLLKARPDKDVQANAVWFNLVLKSLVASNDKNASDGERAEKLLRQMYDLHSTGYGDVHPDASTYNHVLNVYSELGMTEQVENLLKELESKFLTESIDGVSLKPDRVTFTTAIKAYSTRQRLESNSGTQMAYDIAVNATKIFDNMDSLANAGWENLSPNTVTYNTLISIWANVGTREGLHTAANIFQRMCQDTQNPPDSITYTTLIHGWSRGMRYLARVPEAGYRAEQLLHQLEQLPPKLQRNEFSPTKAYNSVITAWSRSGEPVAADKVEELLSQLETKFFAGDTGARPNKTTFLCLIGAYAKSRISDAAERCDALLERMAYYRDTLGVTDVDPDKTVYNAILNALAKSSQLSAVEKAEDILTMMQTSPDTSLRPDIITYATVIDCHTKCGGSPDRAEELLRFVEGTFRNGDKGLEPNAVFYSAILQAWAKTSTKDGAHKAEELLRRNIALYDEGHQYAAPHSILYNAVMDAIARSGDESSGPRAEELLKEMEYLYQSGRTQLKPTRRSFNAVIFAYRNNGDGGKKAEEILGRMEQMANAGRPELTPDIVSYNCAISAIVHSSSTANNSSEEEGPGVADRAQALLDRMEERRIQPDGRTYSPVIEAWLKRNDEKGHALAEAMLQQFIAWAESKKKTKKPGNTSHLYEDQVWDVVNAYRKVEDIA